MKIDTRNSKEEHMKLFSIYLMVTIIHACVYFDPILDSLFFLNWNLILYLVLK